MNSSFSNTYIYYHFVLKRIDTSETMLDEEIPNIKIITYPDYYFKVGLNEANNKINDLYTNINDLIDTLKTGKKEVEVSFVRGTIAGPGVFYDSTKHFRSSTYLKYNENTIKSFIFFSILTSVYSIFSCFFFL